MGFEARPSNYGNAQLVAVEVLRVIAQNVNQIKDLD